MKTKWMLVLLLALSGCTPLTSLFGGPSQAETPRERLKAECAEKGGEWTQGGCVVELKEGASV